MPHARRAAIRRELTRIVVTEVPPVVRRRASSIALGVRDMGENRQQEFIGEGGGVDGPATGLRWHFIGQAQTNKARAIRAAASVVHSVDRAKIADALDAAAPDEAAVLDVLLQVNLTERPRPRRRRPGGSERLAEHVIGCRTLRLRGVMAVAPLDGAARSGVRTTARLRGARAGRRARRDLDLRRNDGGLRRRDRRRCDTPADRVGNHGPEARARLTSEQASTQSSEKQEDAMSNPLKKTMVYLGLADEEEVYEEPAPQPTEPQTSPVPSRRPLP